jgi:putative radical SAM enzyme (TIGR03279 family)
MSVKITGVTQGSPAEKRGVRAGDTLVTVNGHEIDDVLDYRFYIVDTRIRLGLERAGGGAYSVTLRKDEYDDPGLCFETYLMDKKHSCRNHCVFCFIDQLPKGLRQTLYFKDDDERLSFLMGNYITLTNLSEREVSRIIAMHLSPVNISVHTTDPELRVRMMRNPQAGESLGILKRLAQAGTRINCQIVLCKNINDGRALERTMRDLGEMYPSVGSVAVVPVGLTRCREGLYPLEPFTAEDSRRVVGDILRFGDDFLRGHGTRLVYPADEFFLRAGLGIPNADFYENFAQIENGVGMMSLFEQQFGEAERAAKYAAEPGTARRVSVATGAAAGPFITGLARRVMRAVPGLECSVYPIENVLFGKNVNVAGLVAGADLIAALSSKQLGDELLIPSSMLRSEGDIFLDNVSLGDVSGRLGVKVTPVEPDGGEFFSAVTGLGGL